MNFKTKEFKKAKLVHRTATVPLPDLKQWFDGTAEWTVKGLNGNELGRCKEMAEKNRKTIDAVLEALSKNHTTGTVEAVQHMTGLDGHVPMDIALRLELLIAGSVDPVCDIELAVKLNMAFPTEFLILTRKIMHLTGLGHTPGK